MADGWYSFDEAVRERIAGGGSVSEASLAFGREVVKTGEPAPWRTGLPAQLTEAEFDDALGVTFGRFHGEKAREAQARVAETERQLQVERAVLREVADCGSWPKVLARKSGEERRIAESVSSRTGGKSAVELLESGRSGWAG